MNDKAVHLTLTQDQALCVYVAVRLAEMAWIGDDAAQSDVVAKLVDAALKEAERT